MSGLKIKMLLFFMKNFLFLHPSKVSRKNSITKRLLLLLI